MRSVRCTAWCAACQMPSAQLATISGARRVTLRGWWGGAALSAHNLSVAGIYGSLVARPNQCQPSLFFAREAAHAPVAMIQPIGLGVNA